MNINQTKARVAAKETLDLFRAIITHHSGPQGRQVGHTTAMLNGALNTPGTWVVVHNARMAEHIRRITSGKTPCIHLERFQEETKGLSCPILWDNAAVFVILERAANSIADLLDGEDVIARTEDPRPQPDMINHPPHYTQGDVECIDAIEAALGPEGFQAYCRGQAIKYAWRAEHKGAPTQDLGKIGWYADRALAARKKTSSRTVTIFEGLTLRIPEGAVGVKWSQNGVDWVYTPARAQNDATTLDPNLRAYALACTAAATLEALKDVVASGGANHETRTMTRILAAYTSAKDLIHDPRVTGGIPIRTEDVEAQAINNRIENLRRVCGLNPSLTLAAVLREVETFVKEMAEANQELRAPRNVWHGIKNAATLLEAAAPILKGLKFPMGEPKGKAITDAFEAARALYLQVVL